MSPTLPDRSGRKARRGGGRTRAERRIASLERGDHGLSLAAWAAELLRLAPGEYGDPRPPLRAALVLSRAARVALYRKRRAARLGLWHASDLHRTLWAVAPEVAARVKT
jgi:hypothetical protein